MLRRALGVVAAIATAAATGCGQTTTTTPIAAPAALSGPSPGVRTLTPVAKFTDSCDARGIDSQRLRVGRCFGPNGQAYVVENRSDRLRLHELDVEVLGSRLLQKLGRQRMANAGWYLVRSRVTNKGASTEWYDNQEAQTTLLFGSGPKTISPSYVRGLSGPFRGTRIPGHQARVVTTVFIVPLSLRGAQWDRSTGPELQVVNFSDVAKSRPPVIGQIRLFKRH